MTIIQDDGTTWIESFQVTATIGAATLGVVATNLERAGTYLGSSIHLTSVSVTLQELYYELDLLAGGALNIGTHITGVRTVIDNMGASGQDVFFNVLVYMRKTT